MNTTFLKIDARYLNLSAIKSVKLFDDGSIRIFSDVPNAETPGTFYYYDVDDTEMAQKVLDVIGKMSVNA